MAKQCLQDSVGITMRRIEKHPNLLIWQGVIFVLPRGGRV